MTSNVFLRAARLDPILISGRATQMDDHKMTEQEKREAVVRRAFAGNVKRFEEFCETARLAVPEAHTGVLRGSAITGVRWKDGAPFDADGPATSDLDLTLVGADVLRYFTVDGYWVPGIHSRPLSDQDPDIAPELVPLRRRLMDLVGRPVNIQGTRDWVQYLRGELLGQPYLTLWGSVTE